MRIFGFGLSELSLPTRSAAVAAGADTAATFINGDGTLGDPTPVDIFMMLVHVMFAADDQIVVTQGSLMYHLMFRALSEPILVSEQADCWN